MSKKIVSLSPNIGIGEKDRAAIAAGLSKLLADTYTLYLTTHNFHWNVTGPMFNTLHAMFMQIRVQRAAPPEPGPDANRANVCFIRAAAVAVRHHHAQRPAF